MNLMAYRLLRLAAGGTVIAAALIFTFGAVRHLGRRGLA